MKASGTKMPDADTQHPTEIMHLLSDANVAVGIAGRLLKTLARPIEWLEKKLRNKVKFGEPREEPDLMNGDQSNARR